MHTDVVPNRGSTPTVLLPESFREGAKVCKRTLANLSSLSAAQIEAIRAALRGEAWQPVARAFEIIASRAHGHVQTVAMAMDRLGVASLIASEPSRERDVVLAMVPARIVASNTKLATTRWWHTTTLADDFGVAEASEDELYAAMDWLLARRDRIQQKLAARHPGAATAAPSRASTSKCVRSTIARPNACARTSSSACWPTTSSGTCARSGVS